MRATFSSIFHLRRHWPRLARLSGQHGPELLQESVQGPRALLESLAVSWSCGIGAYSLQYHTGILQYSSSTLFTSLQNQPFASLLHPFRSQMIIIPFFAVMFIMEPHPEKC